MPDFIRPTPQNPTLGAIAAALRKAQQFTGQYQVDPRIPLLGGTGVDELLSLPGAASLAEDVSYNGPRALIRGGNAATGGIGTFRPDPRVADLADVATMIPATSLANKGAMALGRAGERAAERIVPRVMERGGKGAELLAALAQGTTSNVVKPKGGNWLAGSVENAVQPLRSKPEWLSGEMINEAAGDNLWAKMVEEGGHHDPHAWLQKNRPDIYNQFIGPEGAAVNRWLDTKLTKYIRNEMGTPEDPVRALAERGVLHVNPDQLNYRLEAHGKYPLPGQQFHGASDAAKVWEGASDNAINIAQPEDYLKFSGDSAYAKTLQENPWVRTVRPDTQIYSPAESHVMAEDLGLPHLVDELKFSMDPNSGLPQHLRFDAKDVDKITVPQAVERVSQINAWRAQEAAKAEKAGMLENLQATPRMPDEGLQLSFVDKPGGAWVDIPETTDAKGMQVCNSIGKAGGWCTQHEWAATSYGSGENRLTALVDAEGRPHAQAKITSSSDPEGAFDAVLERMTPQQEASYMRFAETLDGPAEVDDVVDWMQREAPELYAEYQKGLSARSSGVPDITELKPVGNDFGSERAQEYIRRDPQYKEKVTESVLKFLNSGEWGKVNAGDLDRYDIVDLQDTRSLVRAMEKAYHKPMREIAPIFNEMVADDPTMPRFMTTRQLKDFMGPIEDLGNNYAGGGIVKGAVKGIGEMVEKYLAKEAPAAAPTEQKMLMGVYRGYAGEAPGETVYHAGAAFTTPNPGLFTNPERAAVEQFQRFTGAPALHTLEAKPRRTGTDEDVYAMARRLGIYNPGIPAGQYLERGENAVFPEAPMMIEELRNQGLDSLRLKDGMGKQPSLVALDPSVVRPAPELFATPQRRVAEYYAEKRAAQTGERPHMEMLLVDPFAGKTYGHSTMGTGKQEPMTTRARKLRPEDVRSRTQLYAQGGFVDGGLTDQDGVDRMVDAQNAAEGGRVGYAAGGLVNYDPNEIDTIVSRLKEEIYA